MGTWNVKINGNDMFEDVYGSFYDLYNHGADPSVISEQIKKDFSEEFKDHDEHNNCLFALALAQWETKSLDSELFVQVKDAIELGRDLQIWKMLGADETILNKRKVELKKFLAKISKERSRTKKRNNVNEGISVQKILSVIAPDNRKILEVKAIYVDNTYQQTTAVMSWSNGGNGIFSFKSEKDNVIAQWINSQTLEIICSSDIVFDQKNESFYFLGDQGKVIYTLKK